MPRIAGSLLVLLFLSQASGSASAEGHRYESPNHFSFDVPGGWERVSEAHLAEARAGAEAVGIKEIPVYEAAFSPSGAFDYPYLLVQFTAGDPTVARDGLRQRAGQGGDLSADFEGVLRRTATDKWVSTAGSAHVDFDTDRDQARMHARMEVPGVGSIQSFSILQFGRDGFASILVYVPTQEFAARVPMLTQLGEGARFVSPYRYVDRPHSRWTLAALLGGSLLAIYVLALFLRRRTGSKETAIGPVHRHVPPVPGACAFCTYCGAAISGGARFCGACGGPIGPPPSAPRAATTPAPRVSLPQPTRSATVAAGIAEGSRPGEERRGDLRADPHGTARTKSVVCTHCYLRGDLPRRGTAWPGLPKYACPRCGTKFLYPMTLPNRVAALVFLAAMVASAVLIALKGDVPIPGLLGILLVWGMVRDHNVKSEVRQAEARAASPPRLSVRPAVAEVAETIGT